MLGQLMYIHTQDNLIMNLPKNKHNDLLIKVSSISVLI